MSAETLALYLKEVDTNHALRMQYLDMQYADPVDPMAAVRVLADDSHADIVGISVRYNTIEQMEKVIHVLKNSPRFQEKRKPFLVVGGVMPTFLAKEVVEKHPEVAVVSGEGELAMRELTRIVRDGGSLYEVPSLTFYDAEKGEIIQTPAVNLPLTETSVGGIIEELVPPLKAKGGIVWVSTSRGCPMDCSFCSVAAFREITGAKGVTRREVRPVEHVIDEIQALYANGLRHFVFADDEMLVQGSQDFVRWHKLAEGFNRIGNDITVQCSVRSDVIVNKKDKDGGVARIAALRALYEAGMTHVYIGFESGSPNQLRRYNKGETVEDHLEAIDRLRSIGILVGGGFIMFDPLMRLEEILENIKFLRDADLISVDRRDYVGDIFDMLRAQRDSAYIELLREEDLLREPIPNTLFYNYEFKDQRVRKVAETCIGLATEIDGFFETLKNAVFAKTMQDERGIGEKEDTKLLNHTLINMRLLDLTLLERLTNHAIDNSDFLVRDYDEAFEILVSQYREERKMIIDTLVDEIRSGKVETDAGEVLLSRILELPEFIEERAWGSVVIDATKKIF